MNTVTILIRHAEDQSIRRLAQDRAIIVAGTIHRQRVDTRYHHIDAAQVVAVIIVAIRGIQTDRANIQDVNVRRADRAKAVTNMTSIHMIEVIREVIATNIVAVEFYISFWPNNSFRTVPKEFSRFNILKAM